MSFYLIMGKGATTIAVKESRKHNVETVEGATSVVLEPEVGWLKEGKEKVTAVVNQKEIALPGYVGGFEVTLDGIGYGVVANGEVVWRVVKR